MKMDFVFLFFIFFTSIYTQTELGAIVGLQKEQDQIKGVDGVVCSVYDISGANLTMLSSKTFWFNIEYFFDDLSVTQLLDPEAGIAYFALALRVNVWPYVDFKAQVITTWKYKSEGKYIAPELLSMVNFTHSTVDELSTMYLDQGKIIALVGGVDGTFAKTVDPKTGKSTKIVMSEYYWDDASYSGYVDKFETIAFIAADNYLQLLDVSKPKAYRYKLLKDTSKGHLDTSSVLCPPTGKDYKNNGSCVVFGMYFKTGSLFPTDKAYEVKWDEKGEISSREVDPKIYGRGPTTYGFYNNEVVTWGFYEIDPILQAKTFKNPKVVVSVQMGEYTRPVDGFGYDPQHHGRNEKKV